MLILTVQMFLLIIKLVMKCQNMRTGFKEYTKY